MEKCFKCNGEGSIGKVDYYKLPKRVIVMGSAEWKKYEKKIPCIYCKGKGFHVFPINLNKRTEELNLMAN